MEGGPRDVDGVFFDRSWSSSVSCPGQVEWSYQVPDAPTRIVGLFANADPGLGNGFSVSVIDSNEVEQFTASTAEGTDSLRVDIDSRALVGATFTIEMRCSTTMSQILLLLLDPQPDG